MCNCTMHVWDRTGLVPDVRVSGEDSILEGLGGHPADGQQPLPPLPVIVRLIDVSCHPKICEEERGREVTLGEHCGAEAENDDGSERACARGRAKGTLMWVSMLPSDEGQ